MKIAVFVEYLPPHMGSDYRIYQIMKELAKKNFEISFLVFPPLRALGGFTDNSLENYLSHREHSKLPRNCSSEYLKTPKTIAKLWSKVIPLAYFLTVMVFSVRCFKLLKSINPNIVIVAHPSYHCGLVGAITARILNIPIVLDYPDLWTPMTEETLSWKHGTFKSAILEKIEYIPVRLASQIIVVTNTIKDRILLKGINKSKVTSLPNGVSFTELQSKPAIESDSLDFSNKKVILFCGRLELWSGVDLLLEAIQIVQRFFPNSIFVIVGDGSYRKSIEKEIESRNLKKSIHVTGFLPREQVWTVIKRADVCLSFFSEGDTKKAAMPIKLLEYMAFGKPIVTSECMGLFGFLKDHENVLVTRNDSNEIASAILVLLNNHALASSLGANAQRLARLFDWEQLGRNFEKACLSVVNLEKLETSASEDSGRLFS